MDKIKIYCIGALFTVGLTVLLVMNSSLHAWMDKPITDMTNSDVLFILITAALLGRK